MNKELANMVLQSMASTADDIAELRVVVIDNPNIRDTSKMVLETGEKFLVNLNNHLQSVLDENDTELPLGVSNIVTQCSVLNVIARSLLVIAYHEIETMKIEE